MKEPPLPVHLQNRSRNRITKGYDTVYPGSEYSAEEVNFIRAMDGWIIKTHIRFPTFVQVLGVAKSLGYRKVEIKGGDGFMTEAQFKSMWAKLVAEATYFATWTSTSMDDDVVAALGTAAIRDDVLQILKDHGVVK